MKKIFYIFIFLLFSNNIYAAQDREEELNKLFNQLKNTSSKYPLKGIFKLIPIITIIRYLCPQIK